MEEMLNIVIYETIWEKHNLPCRLNKLGTMTMQGSDLKIVDFCAKIWVAMDCGYKIKSIKHSLSATLAISRQYINTKVFTQFITAM